MANEDVVLSVGVDNRLPAALAAMNAQVKRFGEGINAPAKAIDKALRRTSTAMADLGDAGTKTNQALTSSAQQASRTMEIARRGIARHAADAAKYERQLAALRKGGGIGPVGANGVFTPANGGPFMSEASLQRGRKAQEMVRFYTAQLAQAEARQNALTTAADRSAASLQRVYTRLWGAPGLVEHVPQTAPWGESMYMQQQRAAEVANEAQARSAAAAAAQQARLSAITSEAARVTEWRNSIDRDGLDARTRAARAERNMLAEMARTPVVAREARASMQSMYDEMFGATEQTRRFRLGLGNLANAAPSLRYALYDVSGSLGIAGAAMMATGVAAVVMAARWEQAFAAVDRTVGGPQLQLDLIRESLANLSREIPVAFTQLTEIAALGAQMGVSAAGIVNFTSTVAKLTATTNLSAESAGTALGRFAALFSEVDEGSSSLAVNETTFDNLASSILKVGVNSVATESGIVNVATQLSSMARYAGYTADQTIGLAGAMSSLNVAPELSRGVMTRIFTRMGDAAAAGGVKLDRFAEISGVSAKTFAEAFGTERFAPIFTQFIRGLGGITESGGDAVTQLHELGITSVRDVPVLQRMAQAVSTNAEGMLLLEQTMADANIGMNQGIELNLQYAKIATTVSSRAKVLMQSFESLFATMGDGALGPVGDLLKGITNLVQGFEGLVSSPVGGWFASIGAMGAIAAGGITLLAAGAARTSAAIVGFGQVWGEATGRIEAGANLSAKAVTRINKVVAGLGIAGAALGLVTFFWSLHEASKAAQNTITDTTGALAAMQQDAAGGGEIYREYSAAVGSVSDEASDTQAQLGLMSEAVGATSGAAEDGSSALDSMADSAEGAKVAFGEASLAFVRDSQMASEEFQNLFKESKNIFGGEFGTGDRTASWRTLLDAGFNLDDLNREMAEGGRAAADAYMMGFVDYGTASKDLLALNKELKDFSEETVNGMEKVGLQAEATGESISSIGTAAAEIPEEIAAIGQSSVKMAEAVGEGLAEFTDTKNLISLTQELADVNRLIEKGASQEDIDAATQAYQDSWTDAFGGVSFSLAEYLETFRDAAGEQQKMTEGITTLTRRFSEMGLDTAILADLGKMGPAGARLVEALVDGTDDELREYVKLYGQTGRDAMVALAAAQLSASTLVANAAEELGDEAFAAFSEALSSGTPLEEALTAWGLDQNGRLMIDVDADASGFDSVLRDANDNLILWDQASGEATILADKAPADGSLLDSETRLYYWDKSEGTARLLGNKGPWENTYYDAQGRLRVWDKSSGESRLLSDDEQAKLKMRDMINRLSDYDGMSATATLRITGYLDEAFRNSVRAYNKAAGLSSTRGVSIADFPYASGGYTGPGGKYDPAGIVHKGEFVMTKEATSRIGVGNLYAMMHGATNNVIPARPSSGYAGGGEVRAAASTGYIESFGPLAQQQLATALRTILTLDGEVVSDSMASRNAFNERIGRG